MKVLKFGGTSLGNSDRMKNVAGIVSSNKDCIVVCSAMGGVTDSLIDITRLWADGKLQESCKKLKAIEERFYNLCSELFDDTTYAKEIAEVVKQHFDVYYEMLNNSTELENKNALLALGELVTSSIFNSYLQQTGLQSTFLNAFDFMRLNDEEEPVLHDINERLNKLDAYKGEGIFVTQGFICLDCNGQVTNLKRGGSDYTATLVGAAIDADSVEIWTDIDGLHNNDPRFVENTQPVGELSFAEAAELAYFGAKILHPSCVWPARIKKTPVFLKNTLNPDAPGTCIRSESSANCLKAVSAKDNIVIIRITSGRMVNAYGFLKKVFEVFDHHKIPVDTVTTSEVSVSMTIDNEIDISPLVKDLEKLGRVYVEKDQCIVCVVGDILQPGHVADIFHMVKLYDIKMISLGASSNNITLVLPKDQKINALKALQPIFSDCLTKNTENKKCIQN